MRLPNPAVAEDGPGLNKFGSFSCPAGVEQKESTLMPSKAVQKDLKAMPRSKRIIMSDDEEDAVRRTPKAVRSKPAAGTPSSTDWVDSRKVSNMTQQERERNVQTAIEQRKQHGITVKGANKAIAKAPRAKYAYDQESDDDVLRLETPISNANALKRALSSSSGGSFKSSLLNETFSEEQEDALEQAHQKRMREESELRAQRAESRTFAGRTFSSTSAAASSTSKSGGDGSSGAQLKDIYAKGRSQLEAIDLEDSDDDVVVVRKPVAGRRDKEARRQEREEVVEVVQVESDDQDGSESDGGYHSDMDRGAVQALANKVLQQCDALSRNLRMSLVQWETGGDVEAASAAGAGRAGAAPGRDCVDLTSIRAPSGTGDSTTGVSRDTGNSSSGGDDMKQILYDEDIQKLCPELRLKGYQLVGVNWLKLLHLNNVNGVLADDMGLGKTVQTIAFLGWLASLHPVSSTGIRKVPRPHLIVVPASTLSNWEIELRRFCPAFTVLTYHGSQNERAALRYEIRSGHSTPDVILTTYTIFERESNKSDRAFMLSQQFEYLVLDEAHGIKNAQSSRFVNLNVLKTRHRMLLSGTPVQNDIGELLSMLSFLMPQVFGRDNRDVLIEALNWSTSNVGGANNTAQKQQQGDLSLAQLRSMLAPFVLRRLKRDVLDQLTEKTNIIKRLTMTPFQQKVYDGILLGHAARKDMLKLKHREAEDGDALLSDKVSRTRGADGMRPPPVYMADLTQQSSASTDGQSPFNKKQRREGSTPSTRADRTVVSLLTDDVTTAKAAKKSSQGSSDTASLTCTASSTSSASAGAGLGGTVFPSEIDLAAIAESSINSTDVDPLSAAAVDETAAAAIVQQLSASEASNLFTALRKAANHPLLLRVRYRDPKTLEKIAMIAHSMGHFGNQCDYQRVRDEIDGMSDFDIHQLCLEYEALRSLQLDESALYDSPKMELLRTLLPQLMREGHRVLVFSQWTRLVDLLEVLLQDISLRYLRLDGSTPVKTRQGYIDEFNTDSSISVFLLSTKAGGLGINLTAADTVILHDLDFNPENDKQAEDRCHRIGQTRPVTVYKLFAQETVDEDIFDMGERKSRLSKAVLQDDRQHQQQQASTAAAGMKGSATKRGRGKQAAAADEGDTGVGGQQAEDGPENSSAAISSILQRALLRRVKLFAGEAGAK